MMTKRWPSGSFDRAVGQTLTGRTRQTKLDDRSDIGPISRSIMPREMVHGMSDGTTMKIGFLSQPLTGHLNPMTALARKLQSRGHEIVFIGVPDIEPMVREADLDFVPFC